MDLMTLLAKLTLDKDQYDKGLEEAEKEANNLNITPAVIPKPDNTQFQQGLDEAQETGSFFQEVMTGVWSGIKDAIIATGVVGTVSSIVGWMKQGISLAIDGGKEISDGAKSLQISTKAYQEYEYALGKSNIKVKDLTTAMKRMNEINGDKKLNEDQTKWVEELGLDAEKAAGKEQQLADWMEKLANYTGDDKGRIVSWLFGSNQNWEGFFNQTSEEIDGLKQQADELGLIMSDDSIQNSVRFTDATEQLQQRLEAIQRSFGEGVVPMLAGAVEDVIKIVDFFTPQQSLSDKWVGDDKKFAQQLTDIEGTAVAAETLVDKLLQMGDVSKMTADQYAEWKGTAEWLIEKIPSLSEVINTETGEITANSDEIKGNIKAWEALAKQKALQALSEQKMQDLYKKNEGLISKRIDLNTQQAEAEAKKQAAIKAANDLLQQGYVKDRFQEVYGTDQLTTWSQLQWMQVQSREWAGHSEMNGLINAYIQADNKAKQTEESVSKMTGELEKGEQEYEAWYASAKELFGLTEEQTEASTASVQEYIAWMDKIPTEKRTTIITEYEERGRGMAIGGTIPYDNYPALLHRGERVLTAAEVRRGEGSGNGGSGTGIDHLEDRIAAAIRSGMDGVTVNTYIDGDKVTRDVSERLARENGARRYG